MKDPDYTEDWVDSLTSRLRLDDESSPAPRNTSRKLTMPRKGKTPSSLYNEFEPIRTAPRSLARLRELAPNALLLLYTPVMIPAGYVAEYQQAAKAKAKVEGSGNETAHLRTDPFEMLGRALSKQHSRVRHVPYIPSVGFTKTHEAFLTQADAIIVVTCPPEDSRDLEATLAKEVEFVGNVAHALEKSGSGVPMVNFNFGEDDWQTKVASYGHIWAGERYNKDAVTNVIKLLFGSRK